MTTKQEKGGLEYDFDESILQPTGEEIVRVVYTQPKREGCLRDFCREHGIVCYLPLRKVCRLIRKGYKEKSYQYQAIVLRPMFPNYAFLRTQPQPALRDFPLPRRRPHPWRRQTRPAASPRRDPSCPPHRDHSHDGGG